MKCLPSLAPYFSNHLIPFCLMDINPNIESSRTQKKRIIKILKDGNTPSIYELIMAKCGIDARKRISELRDEGYVIESFPVKVKNADGHTVRYNRYRLVSEPKPKTTIN